MKAYYTILLLSVYLFLLPNSASAQSVPTVLHAEEPAVSVYRSVFGDRLSWGVFGDVNLAMHRADFRVLPGVPGCCPRFESGSGVAFSAGVLGDIPIVSRLAVQLRAGYYRNDALLTALEHEPVVVDAVSVDGVFEHTVRARLSLVAVEPLLRFQPTNELSVFAGGRIGIVLGATYEQREVISEPASGVFTDTRTRERNVFSGDIPNASSVEAALVGGIGYALPLNRRRTLFLVPEVLYSFGLTDVVNELDWSASSLRAGVAVVFMPRTQQEIPELPTLDIPPIVQPQPSTRAVTAVPFDVRLDVVGISATGATTAPDIRIEEFESTEMYPLLNYVFFDDSSAVIPDRYHLLAAGGVQSFDIRTAGADSTLQVYYHLLNIIGQRMQQYPTAMLTLTGCNTGAGAEQNNLALSRSRAEAVKNYFVSVWGIGASRFVVEARNLPVRPSSSAEADGTAENRRVEITASEPALLAPVVLGDTVLVVEPPIVRFEPNVVASGDVHWALVLRGTELLLDRKGDGQPDTAYTWNVVAAASALYPPHVGYEFDASEPSGRRGRDGGEISIERITIEQKRLQRTTDNAFAVYRLILFDYDRADISGGNSTIISAIRQRTQPDAVVRYTGSTDRLGDVAHNKQLSYERAKAAAYALGLPGDVLGTGEEAPPYDNSLPEGRFYSRTVTIHVRNPIR